MDSNLGEPGKDINICLKFCLKMFILLHIPEALRHTVNLGEPGKDKQHFSQLLSPNVYYVAYPRSAQAYGDAMDSNLSEREKVFKCACQLNYVIFTTKCITGLLVYLFSFLRKSS